MRTTKDVRPGYTIHRFEDGAGFALGRDAHVWMTWRMDDEHHAQASVRRFRIYQDARNDIAGRIRFHRLVTQPA